MRSKFKWIFTLTLAFIMQLSFAQEKTVKGVVTDASGPMPGVNVVIKGTQKGVSTGFDGTYAIKANVGDVLVYSFLGMNTVTRTVDATGVFNVKMQDDAKQIETVVITGFGIKRATKDVPYAKSVVKAAEIVQSAPINAVTALSGKVSGLNIITRNNGINPSTQIILRGYRSITGNNGALIVIDGVVQANTALDNLNPNDIASINVLKGASASVLYGSQGANGVLVVTTKQGDTSGKMQVAVNSAINIERIKYFPELQTTFGSGFNDVYDPFENTNWGPRFDGLPRRLGPVLADGSFQLLPYQAVKDNRKNFFVDGITSINGISFNGGSDTATYFFSANTTNVTGITPKDKYSKNNFRFNGSQKFGRFKVSTNASFFNDKEDVVADGGYQGRELYWNVINQVASAPLQDYKDWRNNKFATPEGFYNEYYQNPYMLIDLNRDLKKDNRLFANAKFEFDVTKWLNASYSLTGTFFNRNQLITQDAIKYNAALAPTRSDKNTPATVFDLNSNDTRVNSDLLFTFNNKINNTFKTTLILGMSVSDYSQSNVSIGGTGLNVPGLYNTSVRTGELTGGTFKINDRNAGYFADLTVKVKEFLSLSSSYRYDVSSTLPKGGNAFDYYSFGAALSVSDLFPKMKTSAFNYLKLSASYANVGSAPSNLRGSVNSNFINEVYATPVGFPFGTTVGYTVPTTGISANLKPEFTVSKEFGAEMAFFNNRLEINGTYFNSKTTDQFLRAAVSSASGSTSNRVNSGAMQTKGIELELKGSVIRNDNFEWKLAINGSKIDNKVLELSDGISRLQVGIPLNASAATFAAVGESYPSIFGTAYVRDGEGRVVIDPTTGDPKQSSELKNLGATTPNLVIGLNSSVRYKRFTLAATADYKTGHVFYNDLADALEFTGSTTASVSSGRQPFIFPNSSYETTPGVFVQNTNITTSDGGFNFFDGVYNKIKENYIVDASAIKLREVALTYDVPAKGLEKTFIKSISFGLTARNILMLRSAANTYTDPEFTQEGSQITGVGSRDQLPPTASYGFRIDVKF